MCFSQILYSNKEFQLIIKYRLLDYLKFWKEEGITMVLDNIKKTLAVTDLSDLIFKKRGSVP